MVVPIAQAFPRDILEPVATPATSLITASLTTYQRHLCCMTLASYCPIPLSSADFAYITRIVSRGRCPTFAALAHARSRRMSARIINPGTTEVVEVTLKTGASAADINREVVVAFDEKTAPEKHLRLHACIRPPMTAVPGRIQLLRAQCQPAETCIVQLQNFTLDDWNSVLLPDRPNWIGADNQVASEARCRRLGFTTAGLAGRPRH